MPSISTSFLICAGPGWPYWNCDSILINPPTGLSYTYCCEAVYVAMALQRDNARFDMPANCVTEYITRATSGVGQVNYALMEWQVTASGLTVGTAYSIYIHLDDRPYGTTPWNSGSYEIEFDFVASDETVTLPWVGLEFFKSVYNSYNPWPTPYSEFQLNHVDFTP